MQVGVVESISDELPRFLPGLTGKFINHFPVLHSHLGSDLHDQGWLPLLFWNLCHFSSHSLRTYVENIPYELVAQSLPSGLIIKAFMSSQMQEHKRYPPQAREKISHPRPNATQALSPEQILSRDGGEVVLCGTKGAQIPSIFHRSANAK